MDYEAEDRAASYRFGQFSDVPSIRKAIYYSGFDEVKTLAGWLPIESWKPYGQDNLKAILMRVNKEESRIEEIPTNSVKPYNGEFILGSWPLRKKHS